MEQEILYKKKDLKNDFSTLQALSVKIATT